MEDQNHISTTPAPVAAPQQFVPVQKLKLSEILNDSWELFQKKAWTVLGITLIMGVIMVLVTLAVGIPAMLIVGISLLVKIPALTVVLIGLTIIAWVVAISWVASWQIIATLHAFKEESQQKVLELLNNSKAKARTLLPITIATFLVILGGMVLFVPAVVMTISLAFVSFVAVLEGKGLWESFKASRDLVRGRWWNLLFVLVGFAFIVSISAILTGGSYSPILIVLTPFYYGLLYVLYLKLKSFPPAVAPTTRGDWYYKLAAVVGIVIIAGGLIATSFAAGSNWDKFQGMFDKESRKCEYGTKMGKCYTQPMNDPYYENDYFYDESSLDTVN